MNLMKFHGINIQIIFNVRDFAWKLWFVSKNNIIYNKKYYYMKKYSVLI